MSTNKVRVSPSKNPWNKKKKTNSKASPSKLNNAQMKRQQNNSVSQINVQLSNFSLNPKFQMHQHTKNLGH